MNQPAFQHDNTWNENKDALTTEDEILQALKQFGAEEGPGKYLKQLRELAERAEASFAAELGISLHQLKALEADDFENLPAPIYMKSYYQRYCAVLGVPDEEFLKVYEHLRQSESPQLNRVSIKEKINSTPVTFGWIKYVVIAVVVAAVLFWISTMDLSGMWNQTVGTAETSDQATELSIPQRKMEEVPLDQPVEQP